MAILKCPKCGGEGDKILRECVNWFDCAVCGFKCLMKRYRHECEKAKAEQPKMNELRIRIAEASDEPGFFYDIYKTAEQEEDEESIDGGLCTGSIEDALTMAYEQALAIIKNNK